MSPISIIFNIIVQGLPNKNKALMKAKILRRMTSQDSDDTNGSISANKENIDTNKAAVIIQSRKLPFP